MSSIQVLKGLGSDAYLNFFDVIIPPVSGIDGFDGLTFRIQNFPIPATPRASKYEIHLKSMKLEKLGSKIETEHEISFEIRIDRNLLAYDFFKLWKLTGVNQVTGVIDEELIPKVPITVRSTDYNDASTGGLWIFEDAFPLAIEGFDFSQESDAPVLRNIVLQYSIMNDNLRGV